MSLLQSVQQMVKRTALPGSTRRPLFTIIHQGHEGWRLSLGRNPTRLAPGLRLLIPIYHTVQKVDLRETSVNIHDLAGFTSDNVPIVISGSLFYRVRDSYHACFTVHDFHSNVKNIGTSAMRSVVGHFAYDEVIGDRNKINTKLHDVIGGSIEKWGVDCTRFEIQTFKPSNRDVEKQLELQMQAERERRKQVLDTQALVNVAEGHKQRTILESEGGARMLLIAPHVPGSDLKNNALPELQSQLNYAEGDKRKMILASEGFFQAAVNEGLGLARQVDTVAQSLTLDTGEKPTEQVKLKALDALLELRKLEQLKAIAAGHSNSTYFFGKESGVGERTGYEVDNVEKWKRSIQDSERAMKTL